MNKNILQIFITRLFFVVASHFLYQRVQGEMAHPMAPLSGVGSHFWRPGTGISYSIRPPLPPASCLPMWLPPAVNHTICFAYCNPLVIIIIIIARYVTHVKSLMQWRIANAEQSRVNDGTLDCTIQFSTIVWKSLCLTSRLINVAVNCSRLQVRRGKKLVLWKRVWWRERHAWH